jgi:hypothetical protein
MQIGYNPYGAAREDDAAHQEDFGVFCDRAAALGAS